MELACLAVNMMQLPGSIHAYLKSINDYLRRMNLFGQIQHILSRHMVPGTIQGVSFDFCENICH